MASVLPDNAMVNAARAMHRGGRPIRRNRASMPILRRNRPDVGYGGPDKNEKAGIEPALSCWIPAFAGMTSRLLGDDEPGLMASRD